MVTIADLFGIGFILVTLLMTAALTWLGTVGDEFSAEEVNGDDEPASST